MTSERLAAGQVPPRQPCSVSDAGRPRGQGALARQDPDAESSRGVAWLAAGYAEIRQILGDADRFSALPQVPTSGGVRRVSQPGNLLQLDPPEHTRLRRLLTPEFTVRRMRRLEPRIEAIVAERLDAMELAGPPVDLVRTFAWPVPALATCELLGVPKDDRAELARRANLHRGGTRRGEHAAQQIAASRRMSAYMAQLVARQREEPGEEMIGMLIREHGDELSDTELAHLSTFLTSSGLDNMACMLGLGVQLLLEYPDQLGWLREHPENMGGAVEEMLRYLSVIPATMARTAVADVTVRGQQIKAGERVACLLLSANRDESVVPEPDRLDLTREPASHLAFGHGIHHCLGAPLARMELRIAFSALLRRFPALRLAIPVEDVRFRSADSAVYGVESLPVAW